MTGIAGKTPRPWLVSSIPVRLQSSVHPDQALKHHWSMGDSVAFHPPWESSPVIYPANNIHASPKTVSPPRTVLGYLFIQRITSNGILSMPGVLRRWLLGRTKLRVMMHMQALWTWGITIVIFRMVSTTAISVPLLRNNNIGSLG